jgi:hypothetical protein
MNLQSHQLFAQLCESIVFEASSSMDIIRGLPGGAEVVQQLHREGDLGHGQQYKPVDKIAWSDLKDSYRGAWVIMKYPKGVGAIRATGGNTGSYVAAASTGSGVENYSDSRGGNVLAFLKQKLGGNPIKLWAGNDTGDTKTLKKTRQQGKQNIEKATTMTQEALIAKFKPLWARAAKAAIADIKGMVGIMIKNDSFDKASNKMTQLRSLSDALSVLENGEHDTPDIFQKAVRTAVVLAASHFYPDETGEITRSYGSGYSSSNDAGVKHLLSDISSGDTSKLGTILSFFKRSLIS